MRVAGNVALSLELGALLVGTEDNSEVGVLGAALGGMVVIGLVVCFFALAVTGIADDLGTAAVGWGDCHTAVLEGIAVDVGEIVEHLAVVGDGVLELRDLLLVLVEGQLDGDAATVLVGAELLRVFVSAFEGLHVLVGRIGNRPKVDIVGTLVLNSSRAGSDDRKSRGESSHDSDESLGMHLEVDN